jgi:hypothetical protein
MITRNRRLTRARQIRKVALRSALLISCAACTSKTPSPSAAPQSSTTSSLSVEALRRQSEPAGPVTILISGKDPYGNTYVFDRFLNPGSKECLRMTRGSNSATYCDSSVFSLTLLRIFPFVTTPNDCNIRLYFGIMSSRITEVRVRLADGQELTNSIASLPTVRIESNTAIVLQERLGIATISAYDNTGQLLDVASLANSASCG